MFKWLQVICINAKWSCSGGLQRLGSWLWPFKFVIQNTRMLLCYFKHAKIIVLYSVQKFCFYWKTIYSIVMYYIAFPATLRVYITSLFLFLWLVNYTVLWSLLAIHYSVCLSGESNSAPECRMMSWKLSYRQCRPVYPVRQHVSGNKHKLHQTYIHLSSTFPIQSHIRTFKKYFNKIYANVHGSYYNNIFLSSSWLWQTACGSYIQNYLKVYCQVHHSTSSLNSNFFCIQRSFSWVVHYFEFFNN